MTPAAWMLFMGYALTVGAVAVPLARMIEAVMAGRFQLGKKIEAPLFRLCGIRADEEWGWLPYACGLLVFNGLGVLAV